MNQSVSEVVDQIDQIQHWSLLITGDYRQLLSLHHFQFYSLREVKKVFLISIKDLKFWCSSRSVCVNQLCTGSLFLGSDHLLTVELFISWIRCVWSENRETAELRFSSSTFRNTNLEHCFQHCSCTTAVLESSKKLCYCHVETSYLSVIRHCNSVVSATSPSEWVKYSDLWWYNLA